jgi:hypothetical protein
MHGEEVAWPDACALQLCGAHGTHDHVAYNQTLQAQQLDPKVF